MIRTIGFIAALTAVSACATPARLAPIAPANVSEATQDAAQVRAIGAVRERKRRVAVGRFTNISRYGKALLAPGEADPIANQAADILKNRLAETGRFVVLEGMPDPPQTTSDALIVGAVTQFGRREEGRVGLLSSTKRQVVEATVEARLVDPLSGVVTFTASGRGSASVEQGEVLGYGSRANNDDTLNDKALDAAIADLMTEMVRRLSARPWSAEIIAVRDGAPFLAAGPSDGIAVGDRFAVVRRVRGAAAEPPIDLPAETLALVEIVGFFGEAPVRQGATTRVVSGHIPENFDGLRVEEVSP